ncbi:LLM class flavin-dependent oxidoreductase [Nocardia sp. NPDC004068]|uniref:LLM class flavin-dependent oxidoreductase n=1 Tax=Nocardia sp. NPDC004068 TaxID=3364303 RepID=UPI0036BAB01E
MAEWFVFLPQIRMSLADIVIRARAAEDAGFDGIAFIDHLLAPGAEHQPLWEAMTAATWVAARTDRLRVGHLVLCDAFRHPALLAKQAATLQEASGGRFELGLGSGSIPAELTRFGITEDRASQRHRRLARTLDLLAAHWDPDSDLALPPTPAVPIPLLVGGVGPRTLELVRRHASWWNLPAPHLPRLPELLGEIGSARVSVQQAIGFAGAASDPERVAELARRRFGYLGDGLVCGDAARLRARFAALTRLGVERFYVWFTDFADPATLAEFGESVIAHDAATPSAGERDCRP